MTDLQKQIEELVKYWEETVGDNFLDDREREALSIIKQLQHELSCWQHTHEESKEWIRQLQEENNAYISCLRKINSCDDSATQQSKEAHQVLKQFGKL